MKKVYFLIATGILVLVVSLVYLGVQSSIEKAQTVVESIEDIQAAEGVPVVITRAEKRDLLQIRSFIGSVKGIEQADATAAILEKIETINVSPGDRVVKDQLLLTLDRQNPSTRFRQSQDALDSAIKELERSKNLFEAGGISEQLYERAVLVERIARADFEAVNRLLEIKAPISGIITDVFFERGETVSPGVPILRIADLKSVYTEIEVGESDIHLVKKGLQAEVRTNSAPGRKFTGTVSSVALSANPEARNFTIKIEVPNPDLILKPGMFTIVDLVVGRSDEVTSVPLDALVTEDGVSFIYVVSEDMKAKRVAVTPGIVYKEWVEVTGNVSPGETIILEGQNKVSDGVKVVVVS